MDTQIVSLTGKILELGQMVEAAISRAMSAFISGDVLMAKAVVSQDSAIDQVEVQIQEMCIHVLETQQPSGPELRFVVAVLKINDGLERAGDLAENIARVVIEVGDWERFKLVKGCKELGARAEAMLVRSLRALADRDVGLATQVLSDDDEVDRLQGKVRRRIEHELDVANENAMPLLRLEYITRQLERIGDLATNIAEEVIYMMEGQIVRHDKELLDRLGQTHDETTRFRQVM
jgi:phosphate transport system protein